MKPISKNKKITMVSVIMFVLIVIHSYVQGRISSSPLGIVLTIIVAITLGSSMFKTIIKANTMDSQPK